VECLKITPENRRPEALAPLVSFVHAMPDIQKLNIAVWSSLPCVRRAIPSLARMPPLCCYSTLVWVTSTSGHYN